MCGWRRDHGCVADASAQSKTQQHFLQALQGLPGYGGSENGIGIGLGLQQLAQARAQAQFSAQQCALANGFLPGNAVAVQHGYQAGNSSGSKQQDMARAGMAALLNQIFVPCAQPCLDIDVIVLGSCMPAASGPGSGQVQDS